MTTELQYKIKTTLRKWEPLIAVIAVISLCVCMFFVGSFVGVMSQRDASFQDRQALIQSYTLALNSKDALIDNLTAATVKATDAVIESSVQQSDRANIVIGATEEKARSARAEAEAAQRRAAQVQAQIRARETLEKQKLRELK